MNIYRKGRQPIDSAMSINIVVNKNPIWEFMFTEPNPPKFLRLLSGYLDELGFKSQTSRTLIGIVHFVKMFPTSGLPG